MPDALTVVERARRDLSAHAAGRPVLIILEYAQPRAHASRDERYAVHALALRLAAESTAGEGHSLQVLQGDPMVDRMQLGIVGTPEAIRAILSRNITQQLNDIQVHNASVLQLRPGVDVLEYAPQGAALDFAAGASEEKFNAASDDHIIFATAFVKLNEVSGANRDAMWRATPRTTSRGEWQAGIVELLGNDPARAAMLRAQAAVVRANGLIVPSRSSEGLTTVPFAVRKIDLTQNLVKHPAIRTIMVNKIMSPDTPRARAAQTRYGSLETSHQPAPL